MTHSLRFNGIRILIALVLGLMLVLGAHAQTGVTAGEYDRVVEAWPVRVQTADRK